MKALRWHGRGDLRLDEVKEPSIQEAGDALIEVALCGVCGTDVSEVRSGPSMIHLTPHPLTGQMPPVTLGHELVGTLVEGRSADGLIGPGMRVTVDACLRCGYCQACLSGAYNLCRYSGSVGLHLDGGFAPFVRVPAYTLVAVPDEVSDEQAVLTEPFAVALHGLERAGVCAAAKVLVMGFGPIGAASALVATALGASPFVVEVNQPRRATAESLEIPTLDPGSNLPKRVRQMLGGGGADIVIETTGVAAVAPLAIECATRGGRIALVGIPSAPSEVDTARLSLFERSLVGSLGYKHDLPRVLSLMRTGALDSSALIRSIGLREAGQVISQLAATPSGPIKTIVHLRP